jgi:hypothetical protein
LILIGIAATVALILLIVKINNLYTDEFRVDNIRLVELLNQWHGPSELISVPPPRPVQFTGLAKGLLAIVGLITTGILAVMLLVVFPRMEQERQREALLSQESVQTQGTITRTWTTNRKGGKDYHVAYSYEVNRLVYHSEAEVTSNLYSRLGIRSQLALRYSPSHPEVSRLDGEIRRPVWLIYFGILPFGAFGLLPYLILKQRNLLERGQPAGAIVTRVSPTRGGRSVAYQFLDYAGNFTTGRVPIKTQEAPSIGATVTVIYDPEKSRRNMLYPAQFVRLKNTSRS